MKNLIIKRLNLNEDDFNKKIIIETKQEIADLVKSQNLIDIKTPSFLKAQLRSQQKNNLVELRSRLRKIDSIENIYIQEFNNNSVLIKIKYLGKLDKIIRQLENQKVILKFTNEEWIIKII